MSVIRADTKTNPIDPGERHRRGRSGRLRRVARRAAVTIAALSIGSVAAFAALWGGYGSRAAKLWMLAVVAAGVGGELAQSIGVVPGTFDHIDLGASLVAIAAFVLVASPLRMAASPEAST